MSNEAFWGALGISATILTAGLGIWLASDYKALGLALTIVGAAAVAAIFIVRKRAPSGGRWAPMWSLSMKMTRKDLLPLRRLRRDLRRYIRWARKTGGVGPRA